MTRRKFMETGLAGVASASVVAAACKSKPAAAPGGPRRRPNVVFILTDDQDFNTIGCYGERPLYTPHQDRLAAEGVRFNRSYTTTAVCTPSRYGCLTGQFPSRCPHPRFRNGNPDGAQTYVGFNTPLPPELMSLPRTLKEAGYKTGMVGKWHLGTVHRDGAGFEGSFARDIDPRDADLNKTLERHQEKGTELIRACGFDYSSRIYWNNPGAYRIDALKTHNMEWLAEGALSFMDANKNDPFFLLVSTTLHHVPHPQGSLRDDARISMGGYLDRAPDCMPPRGEIIGRVKAEGFGPGTAYCTYLDDGVGAILRKLDELGVADDTVVVQFSDHQTPDKASLYEPGVRAPMLLRYPRGVEAGQVCDRLVQNLDIAPTILDICGVEPPGDVRIDGKSLLPMLDGSRDAIHEALFFEIGKTRAVCTERHKYLAVRYPTPPQNNDERFHGPLKFLQANVQLRHPRYYDTDQLYDLVDDPDETTNLAAVEPERLRELQDRMGAWLATFGDHPFGELHG